MIHMINTVIRNRDPVVVVMGALLLMLGGVLVMVFPALLTWILGLGLVLGGIAVFATLVLHSEERRE